MSTEKQLDLKKVNEIAQQNQEDILLHKRLSEENKKICREFWHEQMLLRQKYKLLKDFIWMNDLTNMFRKFTTTHTTFSLCVSSIPHFTITLYFIYFLFESYN